MTSDVSVELWDLLLDPYKLVMNLEKKPMHRLFCPLRSEDDRAGQQMLPEQSIFHTIHV